MSYLWSNFNIPLPTTQGILVKSALTGAVVHLDKDTILALEQWIDNPEALRPACISSLVEEDTALIVSSDHDEFSEWQKRWLDTRNNKAHLFTLHLIPTLQCQLRCSYCFEKGIDRGKAMSKETLDRAVQWLDEYFAINPEIDAICLSLFGGEPLLRKNTVKEAVAAFHALANRRKLDFSTELTTNGELLDANVTSTLAMHNLRKIQITLDGPKEIHDRRRIGKSGRPTFDKIVTNIKTILANEYIDQVRLNILLDEETAEHIYTLVSDVVKWGYTDKIDLKLGITTPALGTDISMTSEKFIAEKALEFWTVAQAQGFKIPEEFLAGPWCVAMAKHSAVLQPDGTLQKCFCTVGRTDFNFGDIYTKPHGYTHDTRYEQFASRTEKCIVEKCAYLPICGGGCIYKSVVAFGEQGFGERFCQKTLISMMNEGLLALNYA